MTVFTTKVCCAVRVFACVQKHDPRVTSQTATPLQLVFRGKAARAKLSRRQVSPPPRRRKQPRRTGGDAVRALGKRVRSSSLVLVAGPSGLVRASSRHGRLPLFLLPTASFLDGIAVHVSLAAADWLDVRDQHKVTVVKCDSTENHFRSREKLFPLFF